jgi:hypothetical protein
VIQVDVVSWKSRGIENVNKEWLINLMSSTAIPKANGGIQVERTGV